MLTPEVMQRDLDEYDRLSRSKKLDRHGRFCWRKVKRHRALLTELSNKMEILEDALDIINHPTQFPEYLDAAGRMNPLMVLLQMER